MLVFTRSSASAISSIKRSGTCTPATLRFMKRAMPADFSKMMPTNTGTFQCFTFSMKRANCCAS